MINIALPKGRLGEKVYGMFERAGFDCPAIREPGRKLIFENEEKGLRFFLGQAVRRRDLCRTGRC